MFSVWFRIKMSCELLWGFEVLPKMWKVYFSVNHALNTRLASSDPRLMHLVVSKTVHSLIHWCTWGPLCSRSTNPLSYHYLKRCGALSLCLLNSCSVTQNNRAKTSEDQQISRHHPGKENLVGRLQFYSFFFLTGYKSYQTKGSSCRAVGCLTYIRQPHVAFSL